MWLSEEDDKLIDDESICWASSDNEEQAKARALRWMKPPPSTGKKAPKWRGPEGLALVDVVEDIRYADYDARGGKPLPWKDVLAELHRQGYPFHQDPDKLKADYHSAVAHWSPVYGGRKKS